MPDSVDVIADTILSFTPEELVGALFFGLVVSMSISGLYALMGRKAAVTSAQLSGLILVACLLSMIMASVHAGKTNADQRVGPNENKRWAIQPGYGAVIHSAMRPIVPRPRPDGWRPPVGSLILRAADADHDGRLSPAEAARFVEAADETGEGSVDAAEIDASIREHTLRPSRGNDP